MSTLPRRPLNLTEHSYVPRSHGGQLADNGSRPANTDAHDPLVPPRASNDAATRSSLALDAILARRAAEPGLPSRGVNSSGAIGEQSIRPRDDVERFETALHWLRREATRPPLSIQPERMPSRAKSPSHALRWLSLALIVAGSAALGAYYFSARSSVSASTHASPSQSETSRLKADAPRPVEQSGAIDARDLETSTVRSVASRQADPPSAAPASTVESVGLQALQPADVEAPRRDAPVREIDREEIALLVAQGERLMSAGDIAAARTVFQRASDAGDLAATFALAASYDPAALKQLGVLGKHADLEKARSLYERAERLGSAEATQRLHMLARR